MKVRTQINVMILLLFVLLCFVINNTLNTKVVPYAELGWVVDFRYGICKRGFWGTLYHFFLNITDTPWNKEILEVHILIFHYIMVLTTVVLILSLFRQITLRFETKRFLLFFLFLFLISSFFLKNSFDLNGYSFDLLIFNIYLVVLLLIFYKKLMLASSLAVIGCIFNELACVFWIPIAFTYLVSVKFSKKSIYTYFLISLPFLCGFIIHALGFPAEKLPFFYESFSIKIPQESMDNIIKTFNDQYDVMNYISYRVNFLARHFVDLLFTFLILGVVTFVFLISSLFELFEHSRRFFILKLLFSVFTIFSPLILYFVAIDFWRFVGFVVMNGFLLNVSLILIMNQNAVVHDKDIQSRNSYLYKFWFLSGVLASLFSLFSPSLKSLGTLFNVVSPKTFYNIEGYSPFLFNPVVYDFDLLYEILSVVPLKINPNLRHQHISNVLCLSSGGRIYGKIQSYGKVRIDVVAHFSDKDPDKVKYIKIYDQIYEIHRDIKSSFFVDISRVQSKLFPIFLVVIEPSSYDWVISSVNVSETGTQD